MTDRIRSLTVALAEDVRDDDLDAITYAICMVRGVLSVTTHVTSPNDWTTEQRIRQEVRAQILAALEPPPATR